MGDTSTAHARSGGAIHIGQGEVAISKDPSVVFAAVLGSCVAACVWDQRLNIGGMNHFLLPSFSSLQNPDPHEPAHLMHVLLDDLLAAGSQKPDLQAKLFGGGKLIAGLSDIGLRNSTFAAEFLQREGIACQSTSLGGTHGRLVHFHPNTGQAWQKRVEMTAHP